MFLLHVHFTFRSLQVNQRRSERESDFALCSGFECDDCFLAIYLFFTDLVAHVEGEQKILTGAKSAQMGN